jgi:collagenase-like PrtC family protease
MALGVTTLKIQGREYPPELIAELTKIYRRLMDQTQEGMADIAGAHAALDPVLAARDGCRSAKTGALHARLVTRMAEAHHRDTTDWDPNTEEARLRRSERAV